MTLLLDLGNSRLKVARALPGGGIERLGEAVHRGRGPAAALAEVLAGEAPDTEAWCANTAGAAAGAALKAALNGHGIDAPVFLRARAEGWGLGAFEAAQLGKPVIMTGYGGQRDFLDKLRQPLGRPRMAPCDGIGADIAESVESEFHGPHLRFHCT